ncbi:MAG: hypothetical protein IIX37_07020, partial [Selenomonadaceae bacterium]|nr:hypothetical protein [Selenomonadaceae bacterium]
AHLYPTIAIITSWGGVVKYFSLSAQKIAIIWQLCGGGMRFVQALRGRSWGIRKTGYEITGFSYDISFDDTFAQIR